MWNFLDLVNLNDNLSVLLETLLCFLLAWFYWNCHHKSLQVKSLCFRFQLMDCNELSLNSFCSFCRISCLGKSLHNITGSLQILSGIFVMISTFLYPMGWGVERIASVCIDISPFFPGECSLGYSFYSAIFAITIAMICGVLSLKAEKASMNPTIKRRIEQGNERLVFAPWLKWKWRISQSSTYLVVRKLTFLITQLNLRKVVHKHCEISRALVNVQHN